MILLILIINQRNQKKLIERENGKLKKCHHVLMNMKKTDKAIKSENESILFQINEPEKTSTVKIIRLR